jgi:hypothetical protein
MQTKTTEQAQTIRDLVESIDPSLPIDDQIREERAVEELARDLHDHEAIQIALEAVKERARVRHPAFQREVTKPETDKYSHRIIEATTADVPKAGEQLLRGNNVAMVVRADQYTDLEEGVINPLKKLRGYRLINKEHFPKGGNSHSSIHIDNFYGLGKDGGPDYKYGLTAAVVDQGEVLFVGGLASPKVYGWSEEQYNNAFRTINNSNRINGLHANAADPISPRGVGYREWHESGKGINGDFVATTLHQGDIVVWPQGGEGAKLPAWHGFIQIGSGRNPDFVPRRTTSYHLG